MRVTSVEIEGGRFAGRQTLQIGDVTALWGVNDAGKSTTLTALALLLEGVEVRAGRVCGMLLEADADEADELATRSIDVLREEETFRFEVGGTAMELAANRLPGVNDAGGDSALDVFRSWCEAALEATG